MPDFSLRAPYVSPDLDARIERFIQDFPTVRTSGYRPEAYQRHFLELRDKYQELKKLEQRDEFAFLQCLAIYNQVLDEILVKHRIRFGVGGLPTVNPVSDHSTPPESGGSQAVDIDMSGLSAREQLTVDALLAQNGLERPCGPKDPVHVTRSHGTCSKGVRGGTRCPVDIWVTDPLGRRVGYDVATGGAIDEIKVQTRYSGQSVEPESIDIEAAIPGAYRLAAIGTGEGPYEIHLVIVDHQGNELASQFRSGIAHEGVFIEPIAVAVPHTVSVDVRPDSEDNPVKLGSKGVIPVAILSSADFDAPEEVDISSLTFGHSGTEARPVAGSAIQDVNGDGRPDIVVHFLLQECGLAKSDSKALLKGSSYSAVPIEGAGWIRVLPQ